MEISGDFHLRSTLYLLSSSVDLRQLKLVSMKSGHEVCFLKWYLWVIGKSGKGKESLDRICDMFILA